MGEEADMVPALFELIAELERAQPEGFGWWWKVMPGETHASNPHRTIYDGLETIFADWRVWEGHIITGDIAALEAHFADASQTYGYEVQPPEALINEMGYLQLRRARVEERPERVEAAVRIFRRNVELYPNSANVYDSLADALEEAGDLEEALSAREEAVRRAEELDDPRLDAFRGKRNRLQEKLDSSSG